MLHVAACLRTDPLMREVSSVPGVGIRGKARY
jgi:hypothetical protein